MNLLAFVNKDVIVNKNEFDVNNFVKDVAPNPNLPTNETFDNGTKGKYLPPCKNHSKEQWIGLEIVPFNDHGTHVVDDVCRNIDPKNYVHANIV